MAYTSPSGAQDLGTLASGIWQYNLGSPTNISSLVISGYFAQDYVVGQLNAKIGTCYSGVSGWAISTDIDNSELAILGAMFMVSYWGQKVSSAAGAGGVSDTWVAMRDGDSDIRRASPSELMKIYTSMFRDANNQLNYLTNEYLVHGVGSTLPRSVDFYSFYYGYGYYNAPFYRP